MTASDELPPAAPKYERLPLNVHLSLQARIIEHRRLYGPEHYEWIRNDPEFSPWFGDHLGHRGEKRLDRMIKRVEEPTPRTSNRRRGQAVRLPSEVAHNAPPEIDTAAAGHVACLTLAELSSGPMTIEELQSSARESLRQIRVQMEACKDDRGVVRETSFYVRLLREERAAIKSAAELTQSFLSIANSQRLVGEIGSWIAEELQAQNPELAASLERRLNRVFQQSHGLALRAGERT